jgi:hypothetical protein
LIEKIEATDDENLLMLLKADYDYFSQENVHDVSDELSTEDKDELIKLANEPFGVNAISQEELDAAIKQWRTK